MGGSQYFEIVAYQSALILYDIRTEIVSDELGKGFIDQFVFR
jgi:hypothetical protein